MATVNITYKSSTLLSCRCEENAEIIICLATSLTATGAPFINGLLTSFTEGSDTCGNVLYSYYITYTDSDLADPTTALLSSQIEGVLCRGCLTNYIDYWIGGGGFPNIYFITNEQQLIDFQTAPGSQGIVIASFSLTQDVNSLKPLFIVENNRITCTGFTLAFYGSFNAGSYQCFNAVSGEVLFERGSIDTIYSEWFGAIGNGVNDCYLAIQAALDSGEGISPIAEYGSRVGNEVKLLPGRYLTSATLTVPTNVYLSGTNKVGSIIEANGTFNVGQSVVRFKWATAGQTHSTIRNLTVSGHNYVGVVGVSFGDWSAGLAIQNNYSQLLDCQIIRCTIGAKIDSGAIGRHIIWGRIERCDFDQPSDPFTHILISYGANYITIQNNRFSGGNHEGYALITDATFYGTYIDFVGNSIDIGGTVATDWAAIKVNAVYWHRVLTVVITRNRFEGAGIYVYQYMVVQITDNEITACPRGIFCDGRECLITGNRITLPEVDDLVGYKSAIELGVNSNRNRLDLNTWGMFGQADFSPIPIEMHGAGNIVPNIVNTSITQSGTYERGDIIISDAPSLGYAQQWAVVEAGTIRAGTLPVTGDVIAGDLYHIVNIVGVTTAFSRGSYIDIAGCTGFYKIKGHFGTTILLTTSVSNPVAGAAISIHNPVLKSVAYALNKNTTGNRPTPTAYDIGMTYMDTTLDADGLPIWWNGSKWIKSDGTDAVPIVFYNAIIQVRTEAELITAQADANCNLIIVIEAFSLTGTRTITKGLSILKGCPITTAIYALNINGTFSAPAHRCFIAASGEVNFAAGSIDKILVEWFGAVGDNATDDTTAVQIALDASIDGSFYFPVRLAYKKIYRISTLNIPLHCDFGSDQYGESSPTLRSNAAATMLILGASTDASYTSIHGIILNGNGTATTIIDCNANGRIKIYDNKLQNATIGIDSSVRGVYNEITRNYFDVVDTGILLSGTIAHTVIRENHFPNSACSFCIDSTALVGYNISILDNIFNPTGCTDYIRLVVVNQYQGELGVIARNFFGTSSASDACINVSQYAQVTIEDNYFNAIQDHHLVIDGRQTVVNGNFFCKSTAAAIDLTANSYKCRIGYQQYGIGGGPGGLACAADIADAGTLNFIERIPAKDTTGNRPTLLATEIGKLFLDTTLDADGLPIWWQGTKWIQADGSDA